MQEREPKLGAVVGRKGVGKTFTTNKMMQDYVFGNPSNGIPGRKVLVLDVNDEYTTIRPISPKHIKLFSTQRVIEARRIRPFKENGQNMTLNDYANTLYNALEDFRGGLLLVEDINRYVSDNLPNDVVGAICTNRHKDVDIILHFQSIGRLTPKIWQNINWLRFHKNTDVVSRHKHKFEDKFDLLSITEEIVNQKFKSGDTRYYCFVDIDDLKIRGNITKQQRQEAIKSFIFKNYNLLVGPLLSKNSPYEQKFTKETALKYVMEDLESEYFIQ